MADDDELADGGGPVTVGGIVAPPLQDLQWPPSHWLQAPDSPPPTPPAPAIEFDADYAWPGADPDRAQTPYRTNLDPDEEKKFQTWVKQKRVPFDPTEKNPDYDMRGFWKGLQTGDARATTAINPSDGQMHYPDTWKTPYHKTFSNESIYATPDAPRWEGDRLIDKTGKVIADETPRGAQSTSPTPPPDGSPIGAAGLGGIPESAVPMPAPDVDAITGGVPLDQQRDVDQAAQRAKRDQILTVTKPGTPEAADAATQQFLGDVDDALQKGDLDKLQGSLGALDPDTRTQVMARMDPVAFAGLSAKQELARQNELTNRMLDEQRRYQDEQRADYERQQQAYARASQESAEMLVDAKRLAATHINPNLELGLGGSAAAVILSAIGGAASPYSGGRNMALEQWNKAIENHIGAQRDEIANRWKGIDLRRNAIADELARHGDQGRAETTFHLAAHESLIQQLQMEQQKFDPRGVTASMKIAGVIQQARAQQAQALNADEARRIKNYKDQADAQKTLAESDKITAETAKLRGQLGGGGGGAVGAGPAVFTNQTGVFNPFDQTPIMSRRAFGGKGGLNEGDTKELGKRVGSYKREQDLWAELRDIGSRVGFRKQAGTYVGVTDAETEEYTTVRNKLIALQLGEEGLHRVTPEMLDFAGRGIPKLEGIISEDDPEARIRMAQEDSDREFQSYGREAGFNLDPLISHAQAIRHPAGGPGPDKGMAAAEAALAGAKTDKERKDAQREIDTYRGQDVARKQEQASGDRAITQISKGALRKLDADNLISITFPTDADRLGSKSAGFQDEIEASVRNLNLAYDEYDKLSKAPPPNAKQPGDQAAALERYQTQLRSAADKVAGADQAVNASLEAARTFVKNKRGGAVVDDQYTRPTKFK